MIVRKSRLQRLEDDLSPLRGLEALALVDTKLEEAVVDVRVNLVDCYLMRTSYNQASDVVKAGMADYPKNEALRQAMNRVTAAAADGIGGDWVIVGGGRR